MHVDMQDGSGDHIRTAPVRTMLAAAFLAVLMVSRRAPPDTVFPLPSATLHFVVLHSTFFVPVHAPAPTGQL